MDICISNEKEILMKFEEFIIANNSLLEIDFILFLNQIKKINLLKSLEKIVSSKLNKKIYLIRHANSEHNGKSKEEKNKLIDPDISNIGKEQSLIMREKSKNLNIELVYTSPLKRCISTVFGIFQDNLHTNSLITKHKDDLKDEERDNIQGNPLKIIITNLLRERLKNGSDIGKELSILKDSLSLQDGNNRSFISFDYINKEKWWETQQIIVNKTKLKQINSVFLNNSEYSYIIESEETAKTRIIIMLIWALLREENNIMLVTHSKLLKQIGFLKIEHCSIIEIKNQEIYDIIKNYLIGIESKNTN